MGSGTMPKPLHDLVGVAFLCWVAGAMVLGWLNNRGRRDRGGGTSGDGPGSDDGAHHGGWWGSDADGGHHGGGDGDSGDGGH